MSQSDRDILFSNEAFVIGMLQAVSGGSLIAAFSQSSAIIALSGRKAFLLFLTFMALALMFALLAAYLKHQYKLWDVKAQASASNANVKEAEVRSKKAARNLGAMRVSLGVSLVAILLGILDLVCTAWLQVLS